MRKDLLEISEVEKDYLVVDFGSRWEVEVYNEYGISELYILDRYYKWCKEMRDEDMEYIIDEFGICNRFVDGMWSLCMSDDSRYLYIEKDKYEDLCIELEKSDDSEIYEIVSELEEKYNVVI